MIFILKHKIQENISPINMTAPQS